MHSPDRAGHLVFNRCWGKLSRLITAWDLRGQFGPDDGGIWDEHIEGSRLAFVVEFPFRLLTAALLKSLQAGG